MEQKIIVSIVTTIPLLIIIVLSVMALRCLNKSEKAFREIFQKGLNNRKE